jgi:hypothetical protein
MAAMQAYYSGLLANPATHLSDVNATTGVKSAFAIADAMIEFENNEKKGSK